LTTKHKNKPDWFKIRLDVNQHFQHVRNSLKVGNLHTVCEEARCPNIHECWGRGTATFMILGDICTRSCRFCAVKTGKPQSYDSSEPFRVAEAVRQMNLNHVVVTSVNRDELKDGGSAIWAETVRQIKKLNPNTQVEVLTPDYKGIWEQLKTVLDANPDIFSHNLETVSSLYKTVRPQAKYFWSLRVLENASSYGLLTKSGIMVGLGETHREIISLMKDALKVGVDIFTIGQYLQPSKKHLKIERFYPPEEFKELKQIGLSLGFSCVEAGPLVRSSYHAEDQVIQSQILKEQKQKNVINTGI
jgi:lipoic acid synthetase